MKALLITESLNSSSGWGRYSLDLYNALVEKGINVEVCAIPHPLKFKRNFLFSCLIGAILAIRYRRQSFDLVHCVVEPYSFITLIFSWIKQTPYVLTLHGTYAVRFLPSQVYGWMQRAAYKRASGLVAVSNFTKQAVLKHVPGLNINVIPNGVSQKFLNAFDGNFLGAKEEIILTVAPIKKRKGILFLAQALLIVFENRPNARWILVGKPVDQGYADALMALLTQKGVVGKCSFIPYLDENKLKDLYRTAKVFALTPESARFDFEGFGLVYLEANALGTPAVATEGSGAEEAVLTGVNGYIVGKGDVPELARRVNELLSGENYEKISLGARAWAEEHAMDKIAEKYVLLFKKIA